MRTYDFIECNGDCINGGLCGAHMEYAGAAKGNWVCRDDIAPLIEARCDTCPVHPSIPRIHSPELLALAALEEEGISIGSKVKAIGGHAPGQIGVIQTITIEQGNAPWAQVRFLHLLLAYPLSGLEPLEPRK